MECTIKAGLLLFIWLVAKVGSLVYRGGKNLVWISVKLSGDCREPFLTPICSAAAVSCYAGAVLSVHRYFPVPHVLAEFPIGICLNVSSILFLFTFVVGKLLRYLAEVVTIQDYLMRMTRDFKKIGADRHVDYVCETVWDIMLRLGLIIPICIGHYVWQPTFIQIAKSEFGFLSLFLVFQLLQLRFHGLHSQFRDLANMFEVHVFNARNRSKKKWQLSISSRIQYALVTTHNRMLVLHSNHRELAGAYGYFLFSTLSSYTVMTLGEQAIIENPLTSSCVLLHVLFLVFAEVDLRITHDSDLATLKKIEAVEGMLFKSTRDYPQFIMLWRPAGLHKPAYEQSKYLKKNMTYSIAIGLMVYATSIHLRWYGDNESLDQPISTQ